MKKILLVDDDIVMIKLFQVQIRRAGYEGTYFQDSREALEQAGSVAPDLAVLDYNMPGMNGVELLKALRERLGRATLPVVFVTGEVEAGILAKINELENARLLAKPFSPRRVITLIEEFFAES
jgi:CheY-like chemotaxis protein